MAKLSIGALAVFTGAIAHLLLVHSLLVREGAAAWIAWLSSAAIVALATLTLLQLRSRPATRPSVLRVLRPGAIALVPLGLVIIAVTVSLVVGQGILTGALRRA